MNEDIAQIFIIMAETGEHPKEIKTGMLVPLQKPGKKRPVGNLRHIVLLSVLRKILAICLLELILLHAELHLIKILMEDVKLAV